MSRRLVVGIVLVLVLIVAIMVFDLATAVRPEWPEAREGDPVPARPEPDDEPFHREPLSDSLAGRRKAFLRYVSEQETGKDRGAIWTDIAKMAYDPQVTPYDVPLQAALDHVNAREDTADFTMAGLMRLYHLHGNRLEPDQRAAIEVAILGFKYWLDEPNPTEMELWTENHQILAHSAEYLAGQMFSDETFSNDGRTGREHMTLARERILDWIDWRARTGMAEWDSAIYYRMDLAALLNLVDFAEDEELAKQAAMMVDLMLFDIAADSFYGQHGTSAGRSTASSIKSASGQSLINVAALVWGLGRFQSAAEMGSISLATSERYRLPGVIEAVGQDVPEAYTNYERHSIPITDEAAERYGVRFDDIGDIGIWWGMGAFTHPKTVDLTLEMASEWQLWHYRDFRDLKDLGKVLQTLGIASQATALLNPDPNGIVASEVNKITYRTPDYMLSNAQDYRKGEKAYQQHIWQATLGPYAVVFATNPDSMREDDKHRPSYWASQGRLPRTAQYENVLVAIHDIPRHPSPSMLEARHYAFTHAYFPKWAFDEVVEVPTDGGGGWILGRKGDGYVALYSDQPYEWQAEGPDAGQEIIALGRRNVWIVQMGRAAEDGSFEAFVQAVVAAPLEVKGLTVAYESPGNGGVSFGWDGPLTVDGVEVQLNGYDRFGNPYSEAEFGTGRYLFELDGRSLDLSFETGLRNVVD